MDCLLLYLMFSRKSRQMVSDFVFLHIPMVGSLVVITSRCMVLLFTVRVFTCMQC